MSEINYSLAPARSASNLFRMDRIVIVLCFICAAFSGASIIPTVISTIIMILASLYAIINSKTQSRVWVVPILYYIYTVVSGTVFGGLSAIWENGLIAWAAGEGRVFLYLWPLIYYFTRPQDAKSNFTHSEWTIILRVINAIVITSTTVDFLGIYHFYSSHHIAGTVLGSLLIVNYFTFLQRISWTNLAFLLASAFLFLGSNSRTSMIAVIAAIFLTHVVKNRWRSSLVYVVIALAAVPMMEVAFPREFSRLSSSFDEGTGASMMENFREAALASTPRESSTAWEVSNFGRLEGNNNLAIRGFLWGRAVREFSGSPIIGVGFGRFNDVGRTFTNVLIGEVVVDAAYNNPSVHNAHNSYLHISAELGLTGLFLLLVIFWRLFRHWMSNAGNYDPYWSSMGIATMFALLLSGGTDHSLGAPAFGFTYLAIMGLCYFQTRPTRQKT